VPVEQIQPEDEAFLFIAPSAVEVAQVESAVRSEAGCAPLFCSIPAQDVNHWHWLRRAAIARFPQRG